MRRFACLAVAAMMAAHSGADDPPRKLALLVGVGKYRHSALPDLKYTDADAAMMAAGLRKAGFEVRLLSSSAGGADEPTLANIEAAAAAMLAKVGKPDMALVGLAGHGLQPTGGEQYFCPADANPDTKERLLPLATLSKQLQASGAGVKLLLVDACRNDPDPSRSGVEGDKFALPPRATNFLAMFSCCSGQKAYESEKAGGGHGVFFHHVLEGLHGKAVDPFGHGEVTWDSLALYVRRQVPPSVHSWIGKDAEQRVHTVANADLEAIVLIPPGQFPKPPKLGIDLVDFERVGGPFKVEIRTDKPRYVDGETMTCTVTGNEDCFVTVLTIDPNGDLLALLPNKYVPDSPRLRAGIPLELPTPEMQGFSFHAQAPHGRTLVKAIATKRPLELRGVNRETLKAKGFVPLGNVGAKGFGIRGEDPPAADGKPAEIRLAAAPLEDLGPSAAATAVWNVVTEPK